MHASPTSRPSGLLNFCDCMHAADTFGRLGRTRSRPSMRFYPLTATTILLCLEFLDVPIARLAVVRDAQI